MRKFKVDDKVRVVNDNVREDVNGRTGVIVRERPFETYNLMVIYDGLEQEGERGHCSSELELIVGVNQPDTIYLSGTPGQLEGFRKDWLRAGYVATNATTPITGAGPQGDMLMLSFIQEPQLTVVGYAHRSEGIPVLENWQALLDRAAKHIEQQTKCPVKIAGREVEYKEGLVQIGCRKQLSPGAVGLLYEGLKTINNQGAGIVGLQLHDSHELVDIQHLEQLVMWLQKQSSNK